MNTIDITTPSKKYPVFIGDKVIDQLNVVLENLNPSPKNLLIITDENVGNLYLETVQNVIGDAFTYETIQIQAGDDQKSFENYMACQSFALSKELDRTSVVIALGGGMIGDLAGFVAGTYMRGIRFIQIPTTILAHDSAVGGKTGINHPEGKNMIGVFHQPEAVIYSTDFLTTLPANEIRSGFAEVIKHALIADENLYRSLRASVKSIDDLKDNSLQKALIQGIKIKNEIVTQDEKEKGIRAYLNFGHTLGHAIEGELQYKGITHGEAVALGMLFALSLNEDTKILGQELKMWLRTLGYPSFPKHLSASSLVNRMKKDKKAEKGTIQMVLLNSLGKPSLSPFTSESIERKLSSFIEEASKE
ncbi:3-dehydroquinate synthase [Fictibacillus phosphorivorans]|uniref:3-dehydroquinate synthase n=1 Tax=Fictibacillus phosphorivorans TaxID=1221500 RepID=UPI0012939CB0|nr:3-dehydroquinate synthase [Fictibacillus phosphorivorans]MQR96312.1 3-dehydroquinate synthase [Fictibacillus phosphorivorans]